MTKFAELTSKKARTAFLRTKLATDQAWATKGLIRIFANQTADEQSSETTRVHNNIGFTGSDAQILSSFAKQINRGRIMSAKQMALILKKMPKYARQLEGVSK